MPSGSGAGFGFGAILSRESSERLGLGADESARIVARAGRMVLLESAERDGPAVPWDRDLVLSADVRSFALADLLSLVHASGKSGFLLFQSEDEEKAIYLRRGEVVFAESNQESDRLGACLQRAGALSPVQLDRAEGRYHPTTRFGKILVELGYLTPRELWNGVKTQVEDIVRSLFAYTSGWIYFWEGEIEPDNVVRLSLPTHRLIEEGLARRDELFRFIAKLEDDRTTIRIGREAQRALSENERTILSVLATEDKFSIIAHRSGLDPRTAARTLHFLQLAGQVCVDHALGTDGESAGIAEEERLRATIDLHVKLIGELSAPLVAVDGPADVALRLNRILEEGATRGHQFLRGIHFSEHGALDPEPIAEQALRLTGDRMRAIEDGLGEIVAYLEFELRNHPRIEDSSPFLEAVDPLRAMLAR
ncbi:MAG: DUF4388 domain-containing protein [Myxococcota bacterium]